MQEEGVEMIENVVKLCIFGSTTTKRVVNAILLQSCTSTNNASQYLLDGGYSEQRQKQALDAKKKVQEQKQRHAKKKGRPVEHLVKETVPVLFTSPFKNSKVASWHPANLLGSTACRHSCKNKGIIRRDTSQGETDQRQAQLLDQKSCPTKRNAEWAEENQSDWRHKERVSKFIGASRPATTLWERRLARGWDLTLSSRVFRRERCCWIGLTRTRNRSKWKER